MCGGYDGIEILHKTVVRIAHRKVRCVDADGTREGFGGAPACLDSHLVFKIEPGTQLG